MAAASTGAIFFPTKSGDVSSHCRVRLKHLVEAGYLERTEQLQTMSDGRRPYMYFLSTGGRDLLIEDLGYEAGDIHWKPSYNNPSRC